MQRRPGGAGGDDRYGFQSSPGQKAGCNSLSGPQSCTPFRLFQSSPGQKAGCNRAGQPDDLERGPVSILTRPEGRMQPRIERLLADVPEVSILTRPEGRMQPDIDPCLLQPAMFQSSPGQKAGCNPAGVCRGRSMSRFQSSPGQKAGCNARPFSRRIPRIHRFNPHPARRPDATTATVSQ